MKLLTPIVIFLAAAQASCAPESPPAAVAPPKRILIIRHAEKIEVGDVSEHLSPQGMERAKVLHKLFEKTDERPEPYPAPDFIFAGSNSVKSHRPQETVEPLAKHLKLTVNADYSSDAPKKLAKELLGNAKYSGKTILISWRHSTIPELAEFLKATDAPKDWKDSKYDRLWDLEYSNDKVTFHDRPQQLMPGDSKK